MTELLTELPPELRRKMDAVVADMKKWLKDIEPLLKDVRKEDRKKHDPD